VTRNNFITAFCCPALPLCYAGCTDLCKELLRDSKAGGFSVALYLSWYWPTACYMCPESKIWSMPYGSA